MIRSLGACLHNAARRAIAVAAHSDETCIDYMEAVAANEAASYPLIFFPAS